SELFTSPVSGQAVLNDTKTSTQVFAQILTGGNINLTPEKAKTLTAGFTLQPQGVLNGLRLSVDYYKIRIDSAISTLGAQVIVDTCNSTNAAGICGLVTRDSSGILKSVQVLYLNLNRVDMRGIDIEGSYRAHLGDSATLDLRALATHTISYTNSSQPGINRAGDNGYNGLPSWVLDGFATLNLGRLELTAQEHFISAGKIDASYVGPEDPGYSVTLPNSINTNRVPSRLYTNLGVSFKLIDRGTQNVQLYANVVNLFDTTPPPYWNGNNNSVNYDNIGRRYRVGLRFGF
ncbi:MAG: TonB-dependent receptor, partial [Sphingomonas sp.]